MGAHHLLQTKEEVAKVKVEAEARTAKIPKIPKIPKKVLEMVRCQVDKKLNGHMLKKNKRKQRMKKPLKQKKHYLDINLAVLNRRIQEYRKKRTTKTTKK